MFKIVAEEIVFFMLRHKWIGEEKHEIYEYAMEVLLLNGGLLLIDFIISIIFHEMSIFVAFILIFVPIIDFIYSSVMVIFHISALMFSLFGIVWLLERSEQ